MEEEGFQGVFGRERFGPPKSAKKHIGVESIIMGVAGCWIQAEFRPGSATPITEFEK